MFSLYDALMNVCPICSRATSGRIIVKENFSKKLIDSAVFSARRIPDRLTYAWLECEICCLVRALPVNPIDVKDLYTKSTFNYRDLIPNLLRTYLRLLRKHLDRKGAKSVLEIGGGNGFMLEAVLRKGVTRILEVEPSLNAFDSADEKVKPFFKQCMFDSEFNHFEKFDLVMNFHVFDHVPDPIEFLARCIKFLNQDGKILLAVHNQKSISSRLLRSRSPIYDIEHTFLYSKKTLRTVLSIAGFRNITIKSYWNWVSLSYLIHLLPLNSRMKDFIKSSRLNKLLEHISVCLPLGNIYAIAQV